MIKQAIAIARTAGGAAALALVLAAPAPQSAAARTGEERPTETHSLLGSYLAGRMARGHHDASAAAGYFQAALDRDPDNVALIEQTLLMAATEGNFDSAISLAGRLRDQVNDHRMAHLVLGLQAAKQKQYKDAEKLFDVAGNGVMEQLTLALARAWMKVGQGDIDGAIKESDTINQAEWARFYVGYHKALMYDVAGQTAKARDAYEKIFRSDKRSFRVALAFAHHASAAGDNKRALAILNEHTKKTGTAAHPVAQDLSKRLTAGKNVGLLVATPNAGLAEIFYGLGEALASEGGISVGAVYLQMALYLQPESPFAHAALANVYETTKNYAAAINAYNKIPPGSPLEEAIDIRKAQNLNLLDRVDEAKGILDGMVAKDPKDIRALEALGSMMRGRKRYNEAIDYYTQVIKLIGKPQRKNWTQFYARGTSYERVKKWPQAEADLKTAMQLSPDQPLVLNYLGYSWVDQGVNLQQGLRLIEKAVQLKPDDGYIVDSLGWAHFRLRNYKLAVRYLERAVEIRPEDPTLNDHLGDAFWRTGRKREARFQWSQALTLKPEAEDEAAIRKKLEVGLPDLPKAKVQRGKKARAVRKHQRKKSAETQVFPQPQNYQ
ncbi:MAG: tetratricopeptide repeat protein [Hyphomicrobiaceae bacterium]